MAEYTVSTAEGDFKIEGQVSNVEVTFGSQEPLTTEGDEGGGEPTLTRNTFENTLDKVSRPVKGKYAQSLPSSEEFIRDKRQEVEAEDR